MRFKILLTIAATTMMALTVSAQRYGSTKYLDVGVTGGIANYWGDLSKSPFGKGTIGWNIGAIGRYNLSSRFALRFHIINGKIMAFDEKSGIAARGLSFKSNVLEVGALGEFSILPFDPESDDHRIAPYIFAGIAFFKFNPEAEFNGITYALQPLGTEGQQNINSPLLPYQTGQFAVPMGLGVKFAVSRSFTLGLEMGVRLTFTDYLDDVGGFYADPDFIRESGAQGDLAADLADRSTIDRPAADHAPGAARATVAGKDWYLMGGVTASYNILDGFGSGKRGCPTF